MVIQHTRANIKRSQKNNQKEKTGLIDYIVNRLPEIHIPGYQYCGPGTDLDKRLARGDLGINPLDRACKKHDIVYSKVKNSKERREADKALVARALQRIYSQDSKLSERAAALLTAGLMSAQIGLSKIGLGLNSSKLGSKKEKIHRVKNVKRKRGTKKVKARRAKGVKRKRGRKKVKAHRAKDVKRKHANIKKYNRRSNTRKSIPFGKLARGVKKTNIKRSRIKPRPLKATIKAAIRTREKLKRSKSSKKSRVLKVPKFGGNFLTLAARGEGFYLKPFHHR